MLCSNCGTENSEENVYCIECGSRLKEISFSQKSKMRKNLAYESIRFVIVVFGLLLLSWLLMNMSFIEDIQSQIIIINPNMIIKTIIDIVIIVIILRYALTLNQLWMNAFPKFNQAVFFFRVALYLIVLIIFYDSTLWIFKSFIEDRQMILIYQLLLALVAAILLIRSFIYFYRILPAWLHQIELSFPMPKDNYDIKED